jgi:hypothetical protein
MLKQMHTFKNDFGRITVIEPKKTVVINLSDHRHMLMGTFRFSTCFEKEGYSVISTLSWQHENADMMGFDRARVSRALGLALDYLDYLGDFQSDYSEDEDNDTLVRIMKYIGILDVNSTEVL